MDVPINANVQCLDAPAGHTTCVIMNPKSKIVTHVVVETNTFPKKERIVPIDLIREATPTTIQLQCQRAEVDKMEEFIDHEFIHVKVPMMDYLPRNYVFWPYVEPEEDQYVDLPHEHIPPGELAVHRGAEVMAADGKVGKVDEFLVDPVHGNITHLVLREGHLWGKKDVVVPISEIDDIQGDHVHLKIDKAAIATMPSIPIRRWWQ